MADVDPSQQNDEVKTEENAPINVKVCVLFSKGMAGVGVSSCAHALIRTLACTHLLPHICTTHGCSRSLAGRQLDRGRSLFQNQAKYKVAQVAERICKQGGQGRGEYPVSLSPLFFCLVLWLRGSKDRFADARTHRFLYDGSRINDNDTPLTLDMEDNGACLWGGAMVVMLLTPVLFLPDTIDVMVERMSPSLLVLPRRTFDVRGCSFHCMY